MRSLAVKLDENMARAHARLLSQHGYEVDRVQDEGLSGASDERVWQEVVKEDRIFITLDLDFSDIRRFPPGSHPGLLLLRPESKGRQAVIAVLRRVLQEHRLEDFRGCLVVADPRRTRVRRSAPKDLR